MAKSEAGAVIWKYPMVDGRVHKFSMPIGARVLCVQRQGMSPTIWALVNPDASKEDRMFEIVGTGWTFDTDGMSYIGTWQHDGFVWHLFERGFSA